MARSKNMSTPAERKKPPAAPRQRAESSANLVSYPVHAFSLLRVCLWRRCFFSPALAVCLLRTYPPHAIASPKTFGFWLCTGTKMRCFFDRWEEEGVKKGGRRFGSVGEARGPGPRKEEEGRKGREGGGAYLPPEQNATPTSALPHQLLDYNATKATYSAHPSTT